MGQLAVADKTNEILALEDVWRSLLLEGRVITVDALLTPRAMAQRLVESGGDEVMLVKGHQPQLHHDIRLVFQASPARDETMTAYATMDHRHCHLEERRLTASTALVESSDWSGLAQVFQVEQRVTIKKSGVQRTGGVYGVICLSPARARPEGLLRLVRQHWQIENQVHGVHDVTFDEDRSHVRCAAFRR